jgi:hypothetical protein
VGDRAVGAGVKAAAGIALAVGMFAACDKFALPAMSGPPPDPRVIRTLCTSELGGQAAWIKVWRDDRGAVTVLDLHADPDAKARASTALYDSRGREQLRMPPIDDPGAPAALAAERRRETVIEDSRGAETISCATDGGVGGGK